MGIEASLPSAGFSGISMGIEPGPFTGWSTGFAPDFSVMSLAGGECTSPAAPAAFVLLLLAARLFVGIDFVAVIFSAFFTGGGIAMPGMFVGMDWANDGPATPTSAAARKRGNNSCSFVFAQ